MFITLKTPSLELSLIFVPQFVRFERPSCFSGSSVSFVKNVLKDERLHPHNGRLVPITPELREILDHANNLPGKSEYTFHNKKGEPLLADSYEQNLRRRCKRLEISTSNNHAFRIAYNSKLIELGFSAAERALILGHEVQTNENIYSVTDKRQLVDIRNRLIGNNSSNSQKSTKRIARKKDQ